MPSSAVKPGLETLLGGRRDLLAGRRLGLVANQASVTRDLTHAVDALPGAGDVELVALFAPEHGLRGEAQDMEAVGSSQDAHTGLPVHSLYGTTAASLAPTPAMLAGIDLLVCDLPDVGARYYTFAATVAHVLEAAAAAGIPVVVTDRPNPLGGLRLEGPTLQPGFESFVGRLPVPVRHGLTMGEMALLSRQAYCPQAHLTVVPMEGWRRSMNWDATGLPWIAPSPNMPTLETATVYPGACLVEGTNLSEGRGTTRPFELVGAPWIDGKLLAEEMNRLGLPGVAFRAHWFRPLAQKWKGETCGGVHVHVLDAAALDSFSCYVALLDTVRRLWPDRFAWRTEPYEFETRHPAIDLLAGSDRLRLHLEAGRPWTDLAAGWSEEAVAFREFRRPWLLYPEAEA